VIREQWSVASDFNQIDMLQPVGASLRGRPSSISKWVGSSGAHAVTPLQVYRFDDRVLMLKQGIQVALLGLGNVGQAFAHYVGTTGERNSPKLTIRAVADSSSGLVLNSYEGADRVLTFKEQGHSIREFARGASINDARAFITALSNAGISVLIESLPTNIATGQPALDLLRHALSLGLNVVTVDKGPLLHGFDALKQAARAGNSSFAYSGTTGVSIPAELCGIRVFEIAGVLNGTTNYVLSEMQERGLAFDQALLKAQADGVAEPDPSLDIEGWDSAAKILILAKSLMQGRAELSDVSRTGINADIETLIRTARKRGKVVRLVCRARESEDHVRLTVAPELVGSESRLFSVRGTSKLAIFKTSSGEVPSASRSGRDAIAKTIMDDVISVMRIDGRVDPDA
jgi:homoserine dehydrogenase